MAEKKKKVFDVAKPGESKPDIGSKPMIVGHKSIANDPMVTNDSDSKKTSDKAAAKEELATSELKDTPRTVKKKIEPLSNADKESQEKEAEADVEKKTETVEEAQEIETEPEEQNDSEDPKKSKNTKDKKLDPAAVAMEQEENLKKIIESKKYFVDIKEQKSGSVRTFLSVFLGLVIVGCLVLYILIDAGVLDVDYELPFRIINGS